jgi:hypothetical protein
LDSLLEQEGFTDEFKTKATQLFNEAVEKKASPANWPLRAGLANLLNIYAPILESSDVTDALYARIEELEEAIAYYDEENHKLATGMVGKLSEKYNLDESTVTSLWNQSGDFDQLHAKLQQVAKPERTPRKSFVGEQLEEINEDGAFAQGEEYIDPQMRKYLRYFK